MNQRMTNPTFALALPQLALIRVAGSDAETFLQGQLSNDVRKITPERAQLTSLSSAKGRLLAVFHAYREGGGYLLELDRSLLDTTIKRLRMFVLRSKVTLAEATDLAIYGLAGPGAAATLAAAQLPSPAGPLECASAGSITVTRRLNTPERYTIIVPTAQSPSLSSGPATLTDWKRVELAAGIPTIYPATQDRFVAQMVNLDALGGISFDKGCYTGQEVIARVHYRGAVKRHMRLVTLADPTPAPGAKLPEGEVVDAVAREGGGADALVVSGPEIQPPG